MRDELAALRARLEELAARVGVEDTSVGHAGAAGGATQPGEASRPTPGDVPAQAARVAREAAAGAVVTEQLKAELRGSDRLAAMRFEAAIRMPEGSMSWSHSGSLTRRSSPALARRVGKVLGALGSEARVRLLLLLWDGEKGAQELADGTGLGTGSLYHHMRELLALEWVDSSQRNRYALTSTGRQVLVMAWSLAQVARVDAAGDADSAAR